MITESLVHREWHVFYYEDPELRAAYPLGNFFASDKTWRSVRVRNCLVHTDVGKFELEVYDQVILPKRQGHVWHYAASCANRYIHFQIMSYPYTPDICLNSVVLSVLRRGHILTTVAYITMCNVPNLHFVAGNALLV
jgi:hypothetical protein